MPQTLKTGTRDRPDHDRNAITDNISFSVYMLMQCYKQCLLQQYNVASVLEKQ